VSQKKARIAEIVRRFEGQRYDPHYLAFFECFNRRQFYEAHEVLENIWLPQRQHPNGAFYKGLIQVAGAFVHLQKGRLRPAGALFGLAEKNLALFGQMHEGLDLERVRGVIEDWLQMLQEAAYERGPLEGVAPPILQVSV
jgi:predicted metal-dependent hydrolase